MSFFSLFLIAFSNIWWKLSKKTEKLFFSDLLIISKDDIKNLKCSLNIKSTNKDMIKVSKDIWPLLC